MTFRPIRRRLPALAAIALLAACGDDAGTGGTADLDAGVTRDTEPVDTGRPETRPEPDADTGPDEPEAPPEPPIAVAGDDISAAAGRPITLDGTESSDPDGTIVRWQWDMGNGVSLQGPTVSYTYPDEGVFVVTLTVTDDDGLTATDTLTVDLVVPNEAPTAVIRRLFDGEVVMGQRYQFDGSDSHDDIAVTRWVWDVGVDEVDPIESPILGYAWEVWGDITLTLTVFDTDDVQDSATLDLNVLAPPVADIEAPREGFRGQDVRFDGTGSYDPDNEAPDAIADYAWNFDDGSPLVTGPPLPQHAFDEVGSYDVTLEVTDQDGLTHSVVHKIDIYNQPPEAVISTVPAAVDGVVTIGGCESITFSAGDSIDADGSRSELSFRWEFGDGNTLPGEVVPYEYGDAGTFDVTLTVTDGDGDTDTATVQVVVDNSPPIASFTAPDSILVDTLAVFDASASSDCEGAITSYRWDYGDATLPVSTGDFEGRHTFDIPDIYTVELTVTDEDGATASTTRTVVVEDEPPPPDDISGIYALGTPITLQCANFLGSYAVNINFREFQITDTNPSIRVVSRSSGQPGALTGGWTGETAWAADRTIDGTCTETYTVTGSMLDESSFRYNFTAEFTGSFCLDCLPLYEFTGTATLVP